jgi:hypothetical protein
VAISASWSATTWSNNAVWVAAIAVSMPEISFMKNGSTPRVFAGLASTSPNAPAREPDSARAAVFGCQPSSSATRSTRCRVGSDTPGWPLRA